MGTPKRAKIATNYLLLQDVTARITSTHTLAVQCLIFTPISCFSTSSGVLIYFGYGMWNSTLEITARENEVHASTYQRYDQGVDEGFCGFDDDFYPPSTDTWGASEGGSELTTPPKAKPESDGISSKDCGRTIADSGLAEEDPMDF